MIRSLPDPLRCRGIQLEDGDFSGCSYGYGDIPSFTAPMDCPSCLGSGLDEGGICTIIPHSDFGGPECCGRLNGVVLTDRAEIKCNECGVVVKSIPACDLQRTFDEMELSLDVAVEKCPALPSDEYVSRLF